jgi:hypothetical protein
MACCNDCMQIVIKFPSMEVFSCIYCKFEILQQVKKENSSMSTGCTLVPQTLVLGNEIKATKLV